MKKKVTIQDIADALGISRNTVSKAINNSGGIADSTRERILQKAMEMGYKSFSYAGIFTPAPPAVAEQPTPAEEYQGEIALLSGSFLSHSHFASPMLDKFQQDISQMGYTLNTHRVTDSDIANGTLPITLNPERIKGILCIEMFDWDYDMMLCELDIPILFVDGPSKRNGRSLPADQLYMDNTSGVTRFVNDMVAQGKTKIGFAGNFDHCQSFFERYTAYYLTMLMAGLKPEEKFVVRYNERDQLTDAIGDMPELPEVFVCANDFVALDTIRGLASVGKQVPEDVLICGFDDSPESRFNKPPMTTVHIHTQIIAHTAVFLLLSRIEEPSLDYRTVHTETDLIYRESAKID